MSRPGKIGPGEGRRDAGHRPRRSWSIKFEPRDVWVGLFWDRRDAGAWLYVCIVPCVVLIGEPKS
jgi:hypothetical protein